MATKLLYCALIILWFNGILAFRVSKNRRAENGEDQTQRQANQTEPPKTVHRLNAQKLPIESVVVFNDRAEIIRRVKVPFEAGLNEVLILALPESIMEDTLRVDGKGIVIHDVQFRIKTITEDDYPEELRELYKKKEELEKEQSQNTDRQNAFSERIDALRRMAKQTPPSNEVLKQEKQNFSLTPFSSESIDQVYGFFDLYEQKASELNEQKRKLMKEATAIQKKVTELDGKIYLAYNKVRMLRTATITMDSESKNDGGSLEVRYLVGGAAWYPSYVIRVNSDSNNEHKLRVLYQGNIRQTSGEDWNNTKVVLSTANPMQGSSQIQELGTLNVHFGQEFVPNPRPPMPLAVPAVSGNVAWQSQSLTDNSLAQPQGFMPTTPATFGAGFGGGAAAAVGEIAVATPALPRIEEPESPSGTNSLVAMFNIDQMTSIGTGSGDHKVTIENMETEPRIIHKTTPRTNPNVFITALAKNQSPSPLLAGAATIHYNDHFVSKSRIPRVAPGEKFSCNLGVDPDIVVDYKPVNEKTSEVGAVTKIMRLTHEQVITVENKKKNQDIILLLQENLPKSSEERIEVTLNSPKLTKKSTNETDIEEGAILNSKNNIEWTVPIKANQKIELIINYTIDYPIGEKIQFYAF